MTAGEVGRIGLLLRGCVPTVTTIILLLLSTLPWALPHSGALQPVCAIISVYYWSLYRPEQMPLGAAFLLGILADLLVPRPGGGFVGIAHGQQRSLSGKSFAVAWLGYMLISACAAIVHWIVVCVFYVSLINPTSAVVGHALGVVLYPVVSVLLVRVHRLMRAYDDGA